MANVTFNYEVDIRWATLKETGEVLPKQAADALFIFRPDQIDTHAETVVIRTVTGKKVNATWDIACGINVAELPEVAQIKVDYPKTHYSVWGTWRRVQ